MDNKTVTVPTLLPGQHPNEATLKFPSNIQWKASFITSSQVVAQSGTFELPSIYQTPLPQIENWDRRDRIIAEQLFHYVLCDQYSFVSYGVAGSGMVHSNKCPHLEVGKECRPYNGYFSEHYCTDLQAAWQIITFVIDKTPVWKSFETFIFEQIVDRNNFQWNDPRISWGLVKPIDISLAAINLIQGNYV